MLGVHASIASIIEVEPLASLFWVPPLKWGLGPMADMLWLFGTTDSLCAAGVTYFSKAQQHHIHRPEMSRPVNISLGESNRLGVDTGVCHLSAQILYRNALHILCG